MPKLRIFQMRITTKWPPMRRTTPHGGLGRGCPAGTGQAPFRIPFPGVRPPKRAQRRPPVPHRLLKKAAGALLYSILAGLLLGARLSTGEGTPFSRQGVFSLLFLSFPLRGAVAPLDLSGRPGRRHVLPSTTGSLPIPPLPLLLPAAGP